MARKRTHLADEPATVAPAGVPDRKPKGKRSCEACAVVGPAATVQLCLRRTGKPGAALTGPQDVCRLMHNRKSAAREDFEVIHLDARQRVIGIDHVARGSLTNVEVQPSEVFKAALLNSSAAIVLMHNHPSGLAEASQQDIDLTTRLRKVSELVGIPILDHVIVANDRCESLAERGLMGSMTKDYKLAKG